jgi:hypothetical protein
MRIALLKRPQVAVVFELLKGIGARGVEKAITGRAVDLIHREQRFGDQSRHQRRQLIGLQLRATAHANRGIEGE